jgi:hypothetical protein
MKPINKDEVKKSRMLAEKLTANFEPANSEWEETAKKLFMIEIMMEDLAERKIMTAAQETEIRSCIAPVSYKHILESEYLKENKEKKKRVKISLANNWLDLSGFGKDIRILKC